MLLKTLFVASLFAVASQKIFVAAEVKDVTLRVLFLLDKSVYNNWMSFVGNNENDAFKSMNYFYSKVFTMARDQIKKELEGKVKIDLLFSNSSIEKVEEKFIFSMNALQTAELDIVFRLYRNYLNREFENYDIAFWFTKVDYRFLSDKNSVTKENFKNSLTTGVIVKEGGLYDTVTSVVSGIANSFVMEGKSCVLSGDGEIKSLSSCVPDILELLGQQLNFVEFLVPSPNSETLDKMSCSPAPPLTLDQQCKLLYGFASSQCTASGKTNPCAELGCRKGESCHYYSPNKAFYGTSCENDGKCALDKCFV